MSRKNLLLIGSLVFALGAAAWALAGSEPTTTAVAETPAAGDEAGEPDLTDAWAQGIEAADDAPVEEAAICRLLPQCSKDVDCDAHCGAGQGNCVHSRCPIRVCRCR